MKTSLHTTSRAICAAAILGALASCSDFETETVIIPSAVEEAWDAVDDRLDPRADEMVRSHAESPGNLLKNHRAEWNTTFDTFTLTKPLDRSGRAAMSLFLGDLGDTFTAMDDLARNNIDKNGARNVIIKNFSDQWAGLFYALIYLDATFNYTVETDSWSDNDFDFDATDLYRMLREKEYTSLHFIDGELPAPTSAAAE